MCKPPSSPYRSLSGFSLIELSVVLIILSLLASSVVPGLKQQQEIRNFRHAQQKLEFAREALLSYALLQGALPCPDWSFDPQSTNYGFAAETCTSPGSEGWLPFKTLGIAESDTWQGTTGTSSSERILYRVDAGFTRSYGQSISLTTSFASHLEIVDQNGIKLTSDAERPVAILIATGEDGLLNGHNATFEGNEQTARYESHPPLAGFDDQLLWIGRTSLFSVLIRGGSSL